MVTAHLGSERCICHQLPYLSIHALKRTMNSSHRFKIQKWWHGKKIVLHTPIVKCVKNQTIK